MFYGQDKWIARLVGWALSLLILSSLWQTCHAQEPSNSVESLVSKAFASIPEHRHEYAGAVIRHGDGSLTVTEPAKSLEDSFRLHIRLLPTDKLVAIYHSHPGQERESQVFSTDDIEIANKLNVDSFVYFERSQEVRLYRPGKTSVSTLNTERHELTAVGDKV